MTDKSDNSPSVTPQNWPNKKEADELIRIVFEHYHLHHDIVLAKLGHAQSATSMSFEDTVKKDSGDLDKLKSMAEITEYESAWEQIIALFKTCGIAEDEMFEIEKILDTLPENIRFHFERLVKLDSVLQKLMRTIEKLDYKDAMGKISDIQDRPNPLSGLKRKEYEKEAGGDKDPVKVFKFVPRICK